MSLLSTSLSRMAFLASRMANVHARDEFLPLHSPTSSDDSFSVSSSPPSSPPSSAHHFPGLRRFRTRTMSPAGKWRVPTAGLVPRRLYPVLVIAFVVSITFYLAVHPIPTHRLVHAALNATTDDKQPSSALKTSPLDKFHRLYSHGRGRRPHSGSQRQHAAVSPPLKLTPPLELAAVTSFLTALHDKHINILPPTVDPSKSLDPQLVLGFDIQRHPRAQEELRAMQAQVWETNPVVVYTKRFSPLSRAIKATIDDLHLRPPPTYIDVDVRPDADILRPLLQRITSTTDDFPIILIGGEVVRPPLTTSTSTSIDNNSNNNDNGHEPPKRLKYILDPANPYSKQLHDTSLLEYVQRIQESGELAELLEFAGVKVGVEKGGK